SDRISNALRVTPNFGYSALGKTFLQVQYETVFKQTRYNEAGDFTPPPNTYGLLSLNASTSFQINDQELGISVSGENLLNTLYKEYMNRFRYYAHDRGRNLTLRLSYKF